MGTYSYLDSHFSKILLFLFNQKNNNNGNVLRTYGQLFVKENNLRTQGIRSRKRGGIP